MHEIGFGLIQEKQRAINEERAATGTSSFEKRRERDILTLLIKANMSEGVQPEQRLSVEQILNQIPTFLVAGNRFVLSMPTIQVNGFYFRS